MTDIDWSRLQPLRMAGGSHQKGSGYGCAMNVVSYITGETEISDYPVCADPYLSKLVQQVNDTLALVHGEPVGAPGIQQVHEMSTEDSVALIRLGVKTIGTRDALDEDQVRALAREAADWAGIYHLVNTPATLMSTNPFLWVCREVPLTDLVPFTERILDRWREIAGLDEEVVEVPDLEWALQ